MHRIISMSKIGRASCRERMEISVGGGSSRRRHTRLVSDWSSDVCSSDLVWPVTRTFGVDTWPSHQFLDAVNRLGAVVDGLMMFAAHDDGFFGTGVNAKATVNASHHIDVEDRKSVV